MEKIHLWQEQLSLDQRLDQQMVTIAATIEFPDGRKQRLWYSLPIKYQEVIPLHCNAFVVATLFLAMAYPAELVVHGQVDRQLLQNLAEFQAAWTAWYPRYQCIEITADQEVETSSAASSNQAIMPFSGGVDSCFTLGRHTRFRDKSSQKPMENRQKRNLTAGLMVQGFDISVGQPEVFVRALVGSQVILDSVGVDLIPLVTNFRELDQDWEDAHGAAIVSCLMLLENVYPLGLVASTLSYNFLALPQGSSPLTFPQGSNPLTDRYLSSSSFQVIHDSAGYPRLEKIRAIADWKEVRENLRVCWEGAEVDKNCCQCEKCIRSILSFRALGAGLPSCFSQDVEDEQITNLSASQTRLEVYFLPILKVAKARGIGDSWVKVLENFIHRHERGYAIKAANRFWRQQIPPSIKKPLWQIRRRLIGR